MSFKNLYSMWLDAHDRGALPPEWILAMDFLTWATANRYRVEYGYKGEFSARSCLAAMPKAYPGADFASGNDASTSAIELNAEALGGMKLAALKKLAADLGIDVGNASTKKEVAAAILSDRGGDADAN